MGLLLLGIGLVLLIEGLVYVLAPSIVEQILAFLRSLSEAERRQFGLLAMASGALLIWLAFSVGLGV